MRIGKRDVEFGWLLAIGTIATMLFVLFSSPGCGVADRAEDDEPAATVSDAGPTASAPPVTDAGETAPVDSVDSGAGAPILPPTDDGVVCDFSADCPSGEVCRDGQCVTEEPASDGGTTILPPTGGTPTATDAGVPAVADAGASEPMPDAGQQTEPTPDAGVPYGCDAIGYEICNDIDDDCDGETDEDVCPVPRRPVLTCSAPINSVPNIVVFRPFTAAEYHREDGSALEFVPAWVGLASNRFGWGNEWTPLARESAERITDNIPFVLLTLDAGMIASGEVFVIRTCSDDPSDGCNETGWPVNLANWQVTGCERTPDGFNLVWP